MFVLLLLARVNGLFIGSSELILERAARFLSSQSHTLTEWEEEQLNTQQTSCIGSWSFGLEDESFESTTDPKVLKGPSRKLGPVSVRHRCNSSSTPAVFLQLILTFKTLGFSLAANLS